MCSNAKWRDFSRDPEWLANLLADPLTKDEVQPLQTVAALARAGDRLEREFDRITLPVLILHGIADKASSTDKQLILYEDYFHDLLNDLGRERVMADIINWIDGRIPAGPMATTG